MKIQLPKLILIFLLGILSCKENKSVQKNIEKSDTENFAKPYFEYNEIEYFHGKIDNSLEGLSKIYDKLDQKKIDSLEFKVLIGRVPENVADSGFVKKLNQIGFHKIPLSEIKQSELRKIFVEKNRVSEPKDALKPIFNDILIFKKNGRIVGYSKLSIKYLQSRIIGSKLSSEYFPTNSEHKEIEKILYGK